MMNLKNYAIHKKNPFCFVDFADNIFILYNNKKNIKILLKMTLYN